MVRELLKEEPLFLSLVATVNGALVGHVVFTKCGLVGRQDKVALLGPLAVAPASQGQGIGSDLVRAGLRRLEKTGESSVLVLGDPAYYRRFGFGPEDDVLPPYPLPAAWQDAWQSLRLRNGNQPPLKGNLSVPQPWRQRALWEP